MGKTCSNNHVSLVKNNIVRYQSLACVAGVAGGESRLMIAECREASVVNHLKSRGRCTIPHQDLGRMER